MSDNGDNAQGNLGTILFSPSNTLATWYFWIGLLGLLLAVLNLLGMVHPTYRVSWGGMLTFEYMNDALATRIQPLLLYQGDAIFMAFFGGMTFLGARSLIGEIAQGNGSTTWLQTIGTMTYWTLNQDGT